MTGAAASVSPVVVVGEFDGFHLGHRDLVDAARVLATRLRSPVAAVVLDAQARAKVLSEPDVRCRSLIGAGVATAHVLEVPADGVDAGALVDRVIRHTSPAMVVMSCPPEERTEVQYPSLFSWFEIRGILVIEVPRRVDVTGETVTAARVRAAVGSGWVDDAARLLGAPFGVEGTVVHGQQLGRTIGFPTANLDPPGRIVIPANGVYAARVSVGDDSWPAAVNIGTRPTVDDRGRIVVEAHLLGFDADLYGRRIRIDFLQRLRDERRFESLDELTSQLARDVGHVRRLVDTR